MPRYAAIDIGSNSVRMMAADVGRNGRFEVLAEDRQVTRLGESVFRTGSIDESAARSVLAVLERNLIVCDDEPEDVADSIVEAIEKIADGATYDESAGQAFYPVVASPHEDGQPNDYGQCY